MSLTQNYHIAVPTAFYPDETLNIDATFAHIEYLANKGVKSVLVCGSTGEQHSLTVQEKIAMIEQLPKLKVANDFELIFGLASIRQKEAELLAEKIDQSNIIKGILLGFPPYLLPSQAEAFAYASKLILLSNKPTIIYNNPLRTGFSCSLETYFELLKEERVIGIKEAGDPTTVQELLARTSKELHIYAGGEKELARKIDLGFNCLSSIAGNLYPQEIQQWFNARLEKKTLASDHLLVEKIDELYAQSVLPFIKKGIAEKEKIAFGDCRSPLGTMS